MDKDIQKIINFFKDERVKVRYQDKDLILMTSLDWIADDVKKIPQAKDELDVLWIYCKYYIYKLEGGNLATIRERLLAVPEGFKSCNNKIIIGCGILFRFGGFVIANCKMYAAFYLPNTKITTYERHNKIIDVDPNDIY